jgi:hypothetical protein
VNSLLLNKNKNKAGFKLCSFENTITIPQNTKIKPISQGLKPTNPKKKKREKKAKGIKSTPFRHKPPYNHREKRQNLRTTSAIVRGVGTTGLNRGLGR